MSVDRKTRILDLLRGGGAFSTSYLAFYVQAPQASIRRLMGSLQRQGTPLNHSTAGWEFVQTPTDTIACSNG